MRFRRPRHAHARTVALARTRPTSGGRGHGTREKFLHVSEFIFWHYSFGGSLPNFLCRLRRCIPSFRAAREMLPPQSVRIRWMCSHSTRASDGVPSGESVGGSFSV